MRYGVESFDNEHPLVKKARGNCWDKEVGRGKRK